MKFEITFTIEPPSVFGLPQNNLTVVPAKHGNQIYSPTLHIKSGKQVGVGTLSEYRVDNEALKISLDFENTSLRMEDNIVFIKVVAESSESAFKYSTHILENLLKNLTLELGRVFEYECLIIEGNDGSIHEIPENIELIKMATYNISALRNSVINAAKFYKLKDDKLVRALQYYEHSLLLFEKRNQITAQLSRHNTQLLSSIFLNLWKSASVIVGDPSVDNDYQKRYKSLGFDHEFFESKIEYLRIMRNNFDVAHYTLDESSIKEIEQKFNYAAQIVSQILKKYRDTLTEKSPKNEF